MKQIYLINHLKEKLKERKISVNLPNDIYQTARQRYFDKITGKRIALKRVAYRNKKRDIALVYEEAVNVVTLITIHPIKKHQKENRIKSGRWIKL